MTPILATVTGQAFANHGGGGELAPGLGGARVSFTPVQLDQAAAIVDVLSPVEVYTDAQGMIPPTGLWPGEWKCRNHRDLSEFTFVVEAGGVYTLEALRGYVPGPGVSVQTMALPAAGSGYLARDADGDLSWATPASIVDNGDGTLDLSGSLVTDNLDGTLMIGA